MIRAEGLTKYYGSRAVVRNLSFSIQDREIVGFLGLNGAGKTTVLRMLAGLLTPSSGRIEIDGADLLEDPLNLRWRIGFLPEPPPLYDDMAVASYLAFAARLRGSSTADAERRVDEVLETTALRGVKDEPIETLSHGFKQRVGIAQAIVHDPALVILDEPINGLDPVQIVEMRQLIRTLRERHTVLVSSHILPEISQTCDRILILRDGELVAQGSEGDLASSVAGNSRDVLAAIVADRARLAAVLDGARAVVTSWVVEGERDGVVQVRATLAAEAPEAFAAVVVKGGLGLRRLDTVKSELESLFLKLTGANA